MESNLENISVTILTYNSAETLVNTLKSVEEFREVIIIDGYSSDNSVEIGESFSNTKIFFSHFIGFGKLKNLALSHSSNLWVLSLDADEVLSRESLEEIKNLDLTKVESAYSFKRENYILGKKVKYSGLGDEWVVRLFNRDSYGFIDKQVHEFVDVQKDSVKKLEYPLAHYPIRDVSQFLIKIAKYSELASEEIRGREVSPVTPLFKASFAFIRTYFFRLGFLDGWRGLLIAVSNANGRFYRYIRLVKN
jgi:glycosyltransferase involved in cell wall biosynthesis